MTRTEALHAIIDFAGPLGPFQEPDERDRREEAWAADAGSEALEHILDLIIRPPLPGELGGVTPDHFEYELSRILTMIGMRASSTFLACAGRLLDNASARRTIIEVIGSLGLEEGLSLLTPLIEDRHLEEEDAVRLACALGEIGGAAVPSLLDRFEHVTPLERTRVLKEIGVAREAVKHNGARHE